MSFQSFVNEARGELARLEREPADDSVENAMCRALLGALLALYRDPAEQARRLQTVRTRTRRPAAGPLPRQTTVRVRRQVVTREQILDTLRRLAGQRPEGVGPQDIINVVEETKAPDCYIPYEQVQQLMKKLVADREIRKVGRGRYLPAAEASAAA